VTLQIAVVLAIVGLAVVLFVTERLAVDLVALLVLGSLALTGLVTPAEALSGFSNPAVVTVAAVFVLSGALSRTGVASVVGHQVLRFAGTSEVQLVAVIMLTAGVLSAFMNNVGVAALLLPVVMDIAKRTDRPPSRLLIPLAFGALLGGLTTLIGTPPNILVSDALRDAGLGSFQMFDYAPVGVVVMLVGVAFMALGGRHLLPSRDMVKEFSTPDQADLGKFYNLRERLFAICLPVNSVLAGRSLAESRLGSALGLNVIAIVRDGRTELSPDSGTLLYARDRLLVEGESDELADLSGRPHILVEDDSPAVEKLFSNEVALGEVRLSADSELVGHTPRRLELRQRFGVIILAILRDGTPWRTNIEGIRLQPDDTLLVQGRCADLEALQEVPDFDHFRFVNDVQVAVTYRLHERLIALRVPEESMLAGRSLAESRLADAFGLTVLSVCRNGLSDLMPDPQQRLEANDVLLMKGKPEALLALRGLQHLEIDRQIPEGLGGLESERVGMIEAVLSPHTTLAGQTLRQLHFREKYGLSVLAIWREGRSIRTNLRDVALRLGDALLIHGPREKLQVLAREPDFLMLTEAAHEIQKPEKAPLALLVMVAVLLPVILGWLPIAITAVVGAALMILIGCLTMEDAYRVIEWKAVILIAGMLPLGIAMERTGAAQLLAGGVVNTVGGVGALAVVAGLFILAALASQVMPNPAVVVLLAPIALSAANDTGVSPYALMMAVALSASASFLSPVAHPANVLIMGPGGYRFSDYLKVGLPLTLVVLITVLLVLPIFWPLVP
jgi:di/tricarboxylate transporter